MNWGSGQFNLDSLEQDDSAPPRPSDVKWTKNIVMIMEWIIVPFIILIPGSIPALDAQTRLMLGKYMEFNTTEKVRPNKREADS